MPLPNPHLSPPLLPATTASRNAAICGWKEPQYPPWLPSSLGSGAAAVRMDIPPSNLPSIVISPCRKKWRILCKQSIKDYIGTTEK